MDWTEESITHLRGLWQEGLSTAEIGRRMQITKNAVVGKAHRLTLPPRPSPIRKALEKLGLPASPTGSAAGPETRPRPLPTPVAATAAQATRPSEAPTAATPATAAPPLARHVLTVVGEVPPPAPARQASPPDLQAEAEPPALRPVAAAPRRRGLTCCWPLGDPGTKDFHFCGGDPMAGKPYCAEHAALAYVRIRDRRDSVA